MANAVAHFGASRSLLGVTEPASSWRAGSLLMRRTENQGKIAVLLSLDGVKLRKSVVPGDQLVIEIETLKLKSRTGEVYARATVDDHLAAEAKLKFMLMEQQV